MRKRTRFWRRLFAVAICSLVLAVFGTGAQAQDVATTQDMASLKSGLDTTWLLLTASLVFFMQTGFAMLEAGLIRQTSAVNALLENFMDAGLTGILFWAVGFGLAYGTSQGGLVGSDNFFLSNAIAFTGDSVLYATFGALNVNVLTFFFFQFAFAATASTIATGAMAERTDFIGDIIYSGVVAAVIYPVVVHWTWGGGWLARAGFHDFAGSTVVHTVGGVIALVGAIMLGPRKGRVWGQPPKPHNLALATLGTMILWFGWYGFNPGSTLGVAGYEGLMGLVTVNTTLSAAFATMSALFFVYLRSGKWDLSATLNGALAGLVAVTAACGFIAPWAACVIGLVAGVLVIVAADVIERLHIDDPVGAFAVHGACGIFGTLALGMFAQPELTVNGAMAGQGGLLITGATGVLLAQVTGSAATILWVSTTSVVMFGALKAINRLRVNARADAIGIDAYEHGASAWPDVLAMPDEPTTEAGTRAAVPAAGD